MRGFSSQFLDNQPENCCTGHTTIAEHPIKISHSTAHDKPLIAAGSQGFRKCLYGDSGQGGAEGMEARQVQSLPEVLP